MAPHILVCTDGSVYANSVYDHAAWAAKRLDGSLEILHVLDHQREHAESKDWSGNMVANAREDLLSQLAELDAQKSKILQKHGRNILETAKQAILDQGGPSPALTLRNGNFIDTISDVEKNADLLIIGKRGEAADFATMHLGANLERVIRGSKHPVLVTSRAYKPIEKVLIAYDGGSSAKKAVQHAAEGKLLKDLDILLLKVGPETEAHRKMLADAALVLEKAGCHVRTTIAPGEPEDVIVETVNREAIDLLVVGAYGHTKIRQFLVGSTTTALIRTCLIPLLMFR